MTDRQSGAIRRDGALLFDPDGTFADTAPDMAYALNRLMESRAQPTLPFEGVRPHVSHGAGVMARIGFELAPGETEFDELRREFLDRLGSQGT